MKRESKFVILVLIFLLVFLVYVRSKMLSSGDSRWSLFTAESIIKEGNTNLDEYQDILEKNHYYAIKNIDGHYYTIFPIGVSVMAVPFVFIENVFESIFPLSQKSKAYIDLFFFENYHPPYANRRHNLVLCPTIEMFIASFIVALASVFIYLICNLLLKNKEGAILLTFIFAFCTPSWSTASRGLWQHGPSMLMLSIALYLILLAEDRPRLIQFASIPLAFSFVIRPTNAIPIFMLTLYVFVRYRKYFLRYLLWSLVIALPFVIFNIKVYHNVISPYYLPQRIFKKKYFFEALSGNLISPARGLLIFSPILLFSIYGLFLKLRNARLLKLDCFLLVIIFLHWIAISSFPKWWAGHSFGPRLFTDMLPYFVYFLVPVVAEIPKLSKLKRAIIPPIFCFLVIVSFFIHYRGANVFEVSKWNYSPVNVDYAPERVWNWSDIQFLRGIR